MYFMSQSRHKLVQKIPNEPLLRFQRILEENPGETGGGSWFDGLRYFMLGKASRRLNSKLEIPLLCNPQ
jgi:hypothetical protein